MFVSLRSYIAPIHSAAFMFTLTGVCLLSLCARPASAAEPVRMEITRDTWVSAYRNETDGNNGEDSRLKTKGIVELSLLDFDPTPFHNKTIKRAWLYVKPASPEHQLRVTISSISSDWVEGNGRRYTTKPGTASFNWAKQNQTPWAWPGSDITAVIAGQGSSVWGFADASDVDTNGYQRIAIEPRVIAARIAGLSYGLAMIDDVGSEYTRDGEKFSYKQFPNRFVYSKDASVKSKPYLLIETGPHDGLPPGPVRDLTASFVDMPQGQCQLSWTVPTDHGAATTMGFILSIKQRTPDEDEYAADEDQTSTNPRATEQDLALSTRVPAWLVPLASQPGDKITMQLRDVPVDFSRPSVLYIRAVDAAGNTGAITRYKLPARKSPALELKLPQPPSPFGTSGQLPVLDKSGEVFVVDPLDKILPEQGQMIPKQQPGYKRGNHLWSAEDRLIRLHAARSEFVGFQFVVQGDAFPQAIVLMHDENIQATVSRMAYVPTGYGLMPDPVIPTDAAEPNPVKGQRYHTGLVELYVPPGTKPGDHRGSLLLTAGGKTLTLNITLKVWNFKLPDQLSFVPQMNVYGLGSQTTELDYYRLAHLHRTCLNRLPYNWQGRVQPGGAPKGSFNSFDWTEWDKRFGPLLDGSAFADMPRKNVPVDNFYLPLNENWPASIDQGFTKGYWADEALTDAYRQHFVRGTQQIAQHLYEKQWNQTFFEFFLNGKIIFKRGKWSAASSPWIFDEPVATQDFWALRWYGSAFHEGVNLQRNQLAKKTTNTEDDQPMPMPKLVFRADISRPQWQRDVLDGVMDVNVVGGPFVKYQRYVNQRQEAHQEILVHYGSTSPVTQSNTQPAAWCLDTWLRGGDGVLPWQTMGKSSSWNRADTQAMFYPGKPAGLPGPVPSIRLKSYRAGQQTIEYLTILSSFQRLPRWSMDTAVRQLAALDEPKVSQKGEEAADLDFERVSPQSLWRLRTAVGMMLDQLAPPDQDSWRDMRIPPRQPDALSPRLVK